MPNYIDTTNIVNGGYIMAADVKDPLEDLDTALYNLINADEPVVQMMFAQQSSASTPTGTDQILYLKSTGLFLKNSGSESRLVTLADLASPPTIGSTAQGAGWFSSVLIGTTTAGNALEVASTTSTQFRISNTASGRAAFVINGAASQRGTIVWQQAGTDKMEMSLETDGGMYWYHNLTTKTFMSLTAAGALSFQTSSGNVTIGNSGGSIGIYGATPVTRPTYGAPTGTPTRTTFATGTVTLIQLAERVKAVIDDLRSVGLFA
jgi:hypothetical protein